MRLTSLLKTAVAIAAAAVLGHAGAALAAPNASLSPDTDAFRTGGCTGCFVTQMNAATAQFSGDHARVPRLLRRRNDRERRQRLRRRRRTAASPTSS